MKLDLINMSKVPTAESVGENDKVLIESGGEIKKTAASNIGGGGDGGILAITITWEEGLDESIGTFDKTWTEIDTAMRAKTPCYAYTFWPTYVDMYLVTSVESETDIGYTVRISDGTTNYTATAGTASSYPSMTD